MLPRRTPTVSGSPGGDVRVLGFPLSACAAPRDNRPFHTQTKLNCENPRSGADGQVSAEAGRRRRGPRGKRARQDPSEVTLVRGLWRHSGFREVPLAETARAIRVLLARFLR
jgi:hypothetical protein